MDRELHGMPKSAGNEPAKRISMELLGEGARVTRLSLDGTRLKLTIEADLAGSHLETTGGENAAPLLEKPAGGFGNDIAYTPRSAKIDVLAPIQETTPPAPAPSGQDRQAAESEPATISLSETPATSKSKDAEPPARTPQPAPIPIPVPLVPLAPPAPAPVATLSLTPPDGNRETPETPKRAAPPPVLSLATPPPANRTPDAAPVETVQTEESTTDAIQIAVPALELGFGAEPTDKPAENIAIADAEAETPAAEPETQTPTPPEIDLPVFSLASDPQFNLAPAADANPPEAIDDSIDIGVDAGDPLQDSPGFGDVSAQPTPEPLESDPAAPVQAKEKKSESSIGEISLGDFGDIAIASAFQNGPAPASAAEKPKKGSDSGGTISIGDDFGFGIAFDSPAPSSPAPAQPTGASIPILSDIALGDMQGSGQPAVAPAKAPPPIVPKFDGKETAIPSGGSWSSAAENTIPALSESPGSSPAPALDSPSPAKSRWDAEPEKSAPLPPPPPLTRTPSLSAWEAASEEAGKDTTLEESSAIGGDRHGEPQPAMAFGLGQDAVQPPGPEEKSAPAPERKKTPEAGGTTVLIRYTCPKCKTQGMQAVDKVGTVVHCSNCGKAMRLVMKK